MSVRNFRTPDVIFSARERGDHEIWYCPALKRKITVDTRIKSRHTANAIMKAAGLKKLF